MVSERSLEVLRVIVQDYVASREPVGSKSIVERHGFGVSAATIRNDMAALEEEELIAAPHTSSGRVPTDKGYRLFVDRMSELRPLSTAQRQAIELFLGQSVDVDDVLARTVRLLAQLTQQVALVQYPSVSRARVRHIEFVPLAPQRVLCVLIADSGVVEQGIAEPDGELSEDAFAELRARVNAEAAGLRLSDAASVLRSLAERMPAEGWTQARREVVASLCQVIVDQIEGTRQERLIMAGAANLVRTEHDFSGSVTPVLEAIEEQVELLKLFGEMAKDQHGVSVRIGRENASAPLSEASVVASGYAGRGTDVARLGVLGPTRMDYSNNMAAVRAVARYLSRLLGE
ncbi:heat-inducible transcriptional repressor HrcA [Planctomonas sp. JC2975]|uniref:heat-inducible transcriptional repressor HrcA n=1 Tax=Planctomonas sp. JC2975 TaxID=2729626 RepID=UPI00147373A8|nr:heat-inducible transcriptional repressor HrcA [Planctomonas sp. JC2975]NNC10783.1 heat-inducible transcriptional repressor HrcA [Planctomonas sp. JC2975]